MSDIPVVAVEIHNATPMSHDNIAPDVVITGEGANCTTMDNDRHVSPSTRTKVTQNGQVPAVYCDDERDLVSRMQNYSDMPNLESHEKVLDTRSVTFHNAHDTMTTSTKEEVSGVNSHPHPSDTEGNRVFQCKNIYLPKIGYYVNIKHNEIPYDRVLVLQLYMYGS